MTSALKRRMRDRLMELSPRAFEFFAGDLLEYLGLESVQVTRQSGDGGIDAECRMVSGGLIRVPAGIQVKRQKQPVGRPSIDGFIGALANRYSCGIFVTTASFSEQARSKASSSIPHVSAVDGDTVAGILVVGGLGIQPGNHSVDEGYFGTFEARAGVVEQKALGKAPSPLKVTPTSDLISLQALSYALHVDTTTIRRWVERGRLHPELSTGDERRGLFFRRSCIKELREHYGTAELASAEERLEGFLRFAKEGTLNMSYKPVMLRAILDLADLNGEVSIDDLAKRFLEFYRSRSSAGLAPEAASSAMVQPEEVGLPKARALLVRYPLDRFVIKGYLKYEPNRELVRVSEEIWEGLRYRDVVELRQSLESQIARYFAELKRTGRDEM